MAIDPHHLPPRPKWMHTGKRPRYLVQEGPWSKDADKPHDVDATTNAQGDWVCHACGEIVRVDIERQREAEGG